MALSRWRVYTNYIYSAYDSICEEMNEWMKQLQKGSRLPPCSDEENLQNMDRLTNLSKF